MTSLESVLHRIAGDLERSNVRHSDGEVSVARKPSAPTRPAPDEGEFDEHALDERNSAPWMAAVEPRFDVVRSAPQFRELLGRQGLRSEP